jgi:hypothetical protein
MIMIAFSEGYLIVISTKIDVRAAVHPILLATN